MINDSLSVNRSIWFHFHFHFQCVHCVQCVCVAYFKLLSFRNLCWMKSAICFVTFSSDSQTFIDGSMSCFQLNLFDAYRLYNSQYPFTSPGTPIVCGPNRYASSVLNISSVAANGAHSFEFNVYALRSAWTYKFIMDPPPMPMLCTVAMPLQNNVAMAASNIFPPWSRKSLQRHER